jgi:hypothetical protein
VQSLQRDDFFDEAGRDFREAGCSLVRSRILLFLIT